MNRVEVKFLWYTERCLPSKLNVLVLGPRQNPGGQQTPFSKKLLASWEHLLMMWEENKG